MNKTERSIFAREKRTREANKARALASRPTSKAAQAADAKAAESKPSKKS